MLQTKRGISSVLRSVITDLYWINHSTDRSVLVKPVSYYAYCYVYVLYIRLCLRYITVIYCAAALTIVGAGAPV